jgi:hypothetical protein
MQFSPSNKIYAQALEKLRSLTRTYSTSKGRGADDISLELVKTLGEISEQVNGPSLTYKELEYGEVPSSFKMNEFLQSLAFDINVILDEMNINKAAAIFTHNFIKTELLKAEMENGRLHNKIKTLQLYSSNEDSSIIYAGDHFYNDEYIDWERTPIGSRVELIHGDQISLGVASQLQVADSGSKVTIGVGSNGFIGNNQEVFPPQSSESNIGSNVVTVDYISFVQEGVTQPAKKWLSNIVDQAPDTYFEFEKYYVEEVDRVLAKNFNFQYQLVSGSEEYNYLAGLGDQGGRISWGNSKDKLSLNLIIDIGSSKPLNLIRFTPFGLSDNKNAPLLIKSVSVSNTKGDWTILGSENLWVANGIDQNTINLDGENIVINNATYRLSGESIQYIKFEIEQPVAIASHIGHMYYINSTEETDKSIDPQRLEGPVPGVDRIWTEKDPRSSYQNSLTQRRERFLGKRWAIGIRDIGVYSTQYNESSTLISKRFYVPGSVDRLTIEADVEFPEGFSRDTAWVRFYISPDDGNSWNQISRIQDDFLNIPEVLAYNDNTPVELRLPGVKYVETASTPTFLRVKIEIDRPTGDNTLTPVVKSYRIKVKQRTAP